MYICKSNKKLPDEDLRGLAKALKCSIEVIGKVRDVAEWNYLMEKNFDIEDNSILFDYSLKVS